MGNQLLWCIILRFVMLGMVRSDNAGEDPRPSRKSSPKSKKPKLVVTVFLYPTEIPPTQRTEEQWRAVSFGDVRVACKSARLSQEGTIEVLAARLTVYYREVAAEQTVLQQLASTQH